MLNDLISHLPAFEVMAFPLGAVVIGGFLRGFVGFGSSLLTVPVFSMAFSPQFAVAAMVITELVGSSILLPVALRFYDRPKLTWMAVAVLVSCPLGVWFLANADPRMMKVIISISVLVMVGLLAMNRRILKTATTPAYLAGGAIGGLVQGAMGIGGPPIVAVLLAGRDDAQTTRANAVIMMAVLMLGSLPFQWWFGLMTKDVIVVGLLAVPLFMASMWIGSRYFRFGGQVRFRAAALAILAITALATLVSGFAA